MNIVFMGTPDFAVPCLQALIDAGENVRAVFTQPDKPKGRGYKLLPPPVKALALTYNIPVYQPLSLKKGEDAAAAMETLKEIAPDIIAVAAYGKLLPKEVLDLPKYCCINVHASLLPKYRGAAPVQRCILDGEKETGVTTMLMAEGLDTGDMLLKASAVIGEDETASELQDRLSVLGAELLIKTIKGVKDNTITPQKQDDSLSNYAAMLTKDMCPIDFSRTAREVHNHIRGLSASPCAASMLNGKRLKVYRSTLAGDKTYPDAPGTIVNEKDFTVVCGDGRGVIFTEVQAEGGKRMKTADYLRGNHIENGMKLN